MTRRRGPADRGPRRPGLGRGVVPQALRRGPRRPGRRRPWRPCQQVQEVLAAWHACERRLKATTSLVAGAVADGRQGAAGGAGAGRASSPRTAPTRLPDLMRYLVAVDRRLQQLPTNAERDRTRMAKVQEMQDEYAWLLEQFPPGRPGAGGGPGHPLDDRGAAGQLLRARPGHGVSGLRQAHREGRGRRRAVGAGACRYRVRPHPLTCCTVSSRSRSKRRRKHGPVEQFGVLATLSRWRPRVQIPSGPHSRPASLVTGPRVPRIQGAARDPLRLWPGSAPSRRAPAAAAPCTRLAPYRLTGNGTGRTQTCSATGWEGAPCRRSHGTRRPRCCAPTWRPPRATATSTLRCSICHPPAAAGGRRSGPAPGGLRARARRGCDGGRSGQRRPQAVKDVRYRTVDRGTSWRACDGCHRTSLPRLRNFRALQTGQFNMCNCTARGRLARHEGATSAHRGPSQDPGRRP